MKGIQNGAVLQRGADNTCDILLLDCERVPACSFDGKALNVLQIDKTTYRLRGIPVGGPYTVTVDGQDFYPVYVGDVWVLGGQSNMEGNGWFRDGDTLPTTEDIRARYMTGVWGAAAHPLHTLWNAAHRVHREIPGLTEEASSYKGVGPGLAFAKRLLELTGVPQGLLCCAHGGTTLVQWSPDKRDEGENSLFGSMLDSIHAAGSRIAGLFWSQGCSEGMSGNRELADSFSDKTIAVFSALRTELGEEFPIVQTQIARLLAFDPHSVGETFTAVKEQQRTMGEKCPRLLTVPTINLPLDDIVHLSADAQDDVGLRAAAAMQVLRGDKSLTPPIEYDGYDISTDPRDGSAVITVRYRNVVGALSCGGSASGFSVNTDSISGENRLVFSAEVCGNTVKLRLGVQTQHLNKFYLCYGAGLDPYCNVTDEAGRPLPAMAITGSTERK